MKKLVIALALSAVTAMPALAQVYPTAGNPDYTGNDQVTGSTGRGAFSAFAYVAKPRQAYGAPAAVYVNGEYQGADPDPNVRLQLLRDPPTLKE